MNMMQKHIQMMSLSMPSQPAVDTEGNDVYGTSNVTGANGDNEDSMSMGDEQAALYDKHNSVTPGVNAFPMAGFPNVSAAVLEELNRAETEKDTPGNDNEKDEIRNKASS